MAMADKTQSDIGEDEKEAMRHPIEFRCHRCGKVFHQSEGDVFKEDSVGYFYCHDCQMALEKERKERDRANIFKVR